jgi:hypothetical protein
MGLLAEACSMQVEIGGPRGPVVVANTERWQSSLKANFTNAILAALIPLVAFAVFVIVYENRRARSEIEDTVFDASRRLTEAIDAELRHQLGALSTLALSIDLDEQPNWLSLNPRARFSTPCARSVNFCRQWAFRKTMPTSPVCEGL